MVEGSERGIEMKLFKDAMLKEEIEVLDFGIVEAGSSKTLTIYLYNDTKAVVSNLSFNFGVLPEKSLEIISAPKTIQPGKTDKLVLKWSPTMNFRQALEVPITISGDEVYLAEKYLEK